jgi:hypothetical protein
MRLNFVFAIGLFVLGSLGAMTLRATTIVPGPTPPIKMPVVRDNAPSPDKVYISCPQTIQVGPVYVPSGWQSLGSLPRQKVNIVLDKQKRLVVCWYGITGGENNLFTAQLISKPLPAGYDCTIPYPADFTAVCNKIIHVPR